MIVRFPHAEVLVEIARTPEQLSRGLSGRPGLPEDHGMLFDMGSSAAWPFTMRGVSFPLDMLFLDEGRAVVGLIAGATPNTEGPYVVRAPSRWVVEVPGGWAERHGVDLGDRVSFG